MVTVSPSGSTISHLIDGDQQLTQFIRSLPRAFQNINIKEFSHLTGIDKADVTVESRL